MKRRFAVLSLCTVLSLVMGTNAAAQSGGFVEPFDDPALPGWERIGDSEIVDGTLSIHGGSGAMRQGEWTDFEMAANLRRQGEGEILIYLRFSDGEGFTLRIGASYAALLLGDQLLAEGPIPELPEGEWFGLRTLAAGGELLVEIDGQPVMTTELIDGPDAGTVGFFFEGSGEGGVEFVELVSLGSVPAEVSPEPSKTAPEMQPTPTGEFSAALSTESMVVMFEDLKNGMFDAVIPVGSGTLDITMDDEGDLAARATGPLELRMHPASWQSYSWKDIDLSLRVKRSSSGSIGFGLRWVDFIPHAQADSDRGYWIDYDGERWSLSKEDHGRVTDLAGAEAALTATEWHDILFSVRDVSGGTEFIVSADDIEAFRFIDPSPITHGTLAFRTQGPEVELWLDDLQVTAYLQPSETWRQARGPQGASDMTAIAVDPRDWQVAYAGGLDAGLFKTSDGGQTWQEIGLTREVWTPRIQTIVFAPSDPSIMYLGAGGKHISPIWRSDDGGETWQWMRPTGPEGEILPNADSLAVVVMPDDPLHIYFSIGSGIVLVPPEFSGVYESRDGGKTYRILNSGGGNIGALALDPADTRHLLAGSLNASESGMSVLSSTDGGQTWAPSDRGLSGENIAQLVFDPSTPGTVLALEHSLAPEVGGNVFRSSDGGRSWQPLTSHPKSNGLHFSPQPIPTLYSNHPEGLYASTDSGDSWTLLNNKGCVEGKLALAVDNPEVIYSITPPSISVSTDLGATCSESTTGLLAHPVVGLGTSNSNPAVVYIGTTSGVYKSADAGETWELVRKGTFAGIAVDPKDSQTVYLGAVEFPQILKSTDGGHTWTDLEVELEFPGVSTLAIDPNDSQTIYAGTGHGPQMGPGGSGLYKSSDGGDSWQRLQGVPDVAVTAIEIDRGGSGRVAVATMGSGVLISEDDGQTFNPRNNGFVEDPISRQVWALAMHPTNSDILYAGTSLHYGGIGTDGFDGVYKTVDGGQTWTMILGGEAMPISPNGFINIGGGVDALAINPARPDEVYAALHDPGIVLSDDGGQTWEYVNSGLVPLMTHVYPYRMGISPSGDILYATSCGRSIFRNLTKLPEDSLPQFLASLPPELGAADVEAPVEGPVTEEPVEAPAAGGFRLPCLGGAVPLLAIALVLSRKKH